MKKTLCFMVLSAFIVSCGISRKDHERIIAERDSLIEINTTLKGEIEDLKFGAERMFAMVKSHIESERYVEAIRDATSLAERHPGTPQAIGAKEIINQAQKILTQREIAAKKEQERQEKAEKDRLANAMSKMRIKHDDMQNITWYNDKSTPSYTNRNVFYIYVGKGIASPFLRFRIQYTGDDWLFIENYIIKTDNNSYTISAKRSEIERDNGGGSVWEWYDVLYNATHHRIIRDVISSKQVKIRHNGSQYYKDRTLSASEKQALKNVLDAYEALGGKEFTL